MIILTTEELRNLAVLLRGKSELTANDRERIAIAIDQLCKTNWITEMDSRFRQVSIDHKRDGRGRA
jgi:hypothetical protein